tara:strand:- start:201 stop:329 length:129 start_codon:yes stop_codon:yes gene_type:complete
VEHLQQVVEKVELITLVQQDLQVDLVVVELVDLDQALLEQVE